MRIRSRSSLVSLLVGALLLLAGPTDGHAQQSEAPSAPVRYDTDLLPPSFHQDRRRAVLESLPDDAVVIFFSAPERNRENDVEFEYRQDSDLYYLTGTHEAGSVLLLAPAGMAIAGDTVHELLMVPPRNPMAETWLGRRFGAERARDELGIEQVVSNEQFEKIVGALAAQPDRRFYHLPLPKGVAEGSELGEQLEVFREVAHPFEFDGPRMATGAVRYMLAINDADSFDRLRPVLASRVKADTFDDPLLREAFTAFTDAASFDEWQTWRQQHIDARYADGTTLRRTLDRLRMHKTDQELALVQRAIDITTAAHREAMRSMEPQMNEYEIEALIEYVFKRNGAEYTGFPSIVGSGENAVILHYNTNRRRMQAEDMVVMDIGAEYHGYSADVTRTVPVDGTFSPEQKAIYELVLHAQEAGIEATRSGNAFSAPHQAATQVIADGLRELGLIERDEQVRQFFMHGTSHYLGLYVHDVGTGGELAPGTIITVEPGIYVAPSPDVDPRWWNIGVRIEDDVLVTDGDPVVMSAAAPRTVEDIEALMRETGLGNRPLETGGTQ